MGINLTDFVDINNLKLSREQIRSSLTSYFTETMLGELETVFSELDQLKVNYAKPEKSEFFNSENFAFDEPCYETRTSYADSSPYTELNYSIKNTHIKDAA